MVIVPDASVLLQLVLQRDHESDSHGAVQLLDAYRSETIEIHVAKPVAVRSRQYFRIEDAVPGTREPVRLTGVRRAEQPLDRAYCLAVLTFMKDARGLSFYDASYHVLALRCHGLYVTADREYTWKAGRKKHVRLLSEWSPL